MPSPRTLFSLAAVCGALPLAACGGDDAQRPDRPAAVPAEEQVRAVAKAVVVLAGVADCPALFADAPTFEAPSPQQIDRARTQVRGDRAEIDFAERGVETMHLRNVGGRWYIADEAEITS